MQAYSLALRKRVLADCDAGLKTKAVAQRYGVSRTWVRALKQRRRETGEIAAFCEITLLDRLKFFGTLLLVQSPHCVAERDERLLLPEFGMS